MRDKLLKKLAVNWFPMFQYTFLEKVADEIMELHTSRVEEICATACDRGPRPEEMVDWFIPIMKANNREGNRGLIHLFLDAMATKISVQYIEERCAVWLRRNGHPVKDGTDMPVRDAEKSRKYQLTNTMRVLREAGADATVVDIGPNGHHPMCLTSLGDGKDCPHCKQLWDEEPKFYPEGKKCIRCGAINDYP